MNELISVVIPVYNVENYLRRCIKSVLRQSYDKIEIILVDDGSTDNSGKICDEFEKIDSRIKVYHKTNGGLSDARNYGLKYVEGSWITFIDSDDYIDKKYIEKLYSIAVNNNAEISICDPVHVFGESQAEFEDSKMVRIYDRIEAIKTMWYQTSFLPSAWAKLYHKSVFGNICFTEGVIFEDIDIMHEVLYKANRIAYTKGKYYAYIHRENSITTKKFAKRDLYILEVCNKIRKFAKKYNKDLINASKAYSVVGNMRVFINAPQTDEEYLEAIDGAEKYIKRNGLSVLKDKEVRKKTKAGILLFFINKRMLRFVHSRINRWK